MEIFCSIIFAEVIVVVVIKIVEFFEKLAICSANTKAVLASPILTALIQIICFLDINFFCLV